MALIGGERSTAAATRFLEHVLAQLPYPVDAVMTDNDLILDYYNHARPHHSLGGVSPIARRDAFFATAGA